MGNTAGGLPYPEPTAPVREGAVNIRALADALQARGHGARIIGASQVLTTNAGGFASIAFSPAFSAAPVALVDNGDNAAAIVVQIVNTATTGVNIQAKVAYTGAAVGAVTIRVNWIALGAN